MRERRLLVFPLITACAVFAASACAPNEQAQTVSFVLSLTSERLSRVEFVVHYDTGKFAATDGQCVVSSAAGPRSVATAEAQLLEQDAVRGLSLRDKRRRAAVVRGLVTTTTTDSTNTTNTTLAPVTTLEPVTTTTLVGNNTCGDGTRDAGEECDDGNVTSGDGCSGNCDAEFAFTAIDDDAGQLTIRITNGLGIPAGASLAFCKFQGDVATADFVIQTLSCGLTTSGVCHPVTDAVVGVSTTTTTTTTTTSSTTTTVGDGDSTTTTNTVE